MKHKIKFGVTAVLLVVVTIMLCLPTIAFSQKEQARVSVLSCLKLSTELDMQNPAFASIALEEGIHAELLFAATGIDVRQADKTWRYDHFTWRNTISLDFTDGLAHLRERFLAAAQYVPTEIILYVQNDQGQAVSKQILQWLSDGMLPDIVSYDCTWTDSVLTFTPEYRESLLCAAWLADTATNTQTKDLSYLAAVAETFSAQAQHGTERHRASILHDLLIQSTEYYADEQNPGQTASDALLSGQAVCAGYADAYRLLLLLNKIDCQYVIGTVEQNEEVIAHGWNKVKIDDTWYNVDVTWDDPADSEKAPLDKYFLISDVQLLENHTWQQEAWPLSLSSLLPITLPNEYLFT